MRWFEAEQHAHDAMTTSVQALLGPLSIGDILDSYWGRAGHRRTLILAPLINRTIGYGARVEVEGGELELYSIQESACASSATARGPSSAPPPRHMAMPASARSYTYRRDPPATAAPSSPSRPSKFSPHSDV
jgi:hypothetical protein